MKKAFKIGMNILGALLLLMLILILAVGIYDFCTVNHAPIYVDDEESYIKSVSMENDSLKCAVVLCIKNIRYERIQCNELKLALRGRDGNKEQYEVVVAEPKDPDLSYISFPGLRSKKIECTFVVSDFGAPLSIDDIDISSLSYRCAL